MTHAFPLAFIGFCFSFEYLPWAGLHNERHHLVYKHSIVALNLTLFELNCNNLIDFALLVMLQTSADDSENNFKC